MESLFKLKTIIDYYITFLSIWWLKRKIYTKWKNEKESLLWDFL